ncbi:PepSY domain-containing protein [Peribacillus frigoritolerans]|uniref:PepSY domain-containing protein n=1 Tax=Peribacillus frigoritolerans TaxID=450367 RepID=UPI00207ADDA8|nr:PepSY domain-containing protein [Peribacillus frigoritolerans]USK74769.1 PepSY domain-containing protein [Peribacillus frigoritolerans]
MKKQWSTIKEGIIQRKKVIMTVSIASVLLFGGAAGTAVYAVNKGNLSEDEAIKMISEKLGGEVTQFEKDWDQPMTYEMTVKTKEGYQDVDVDAEKGEILSQEMEDVDDEDMSTQQAVETAKVSRDQAEKIALKAVDGQVTDMELDSESGTLVYELEIKQGLKEYDVVVDATTGKVLKDQLDD